MTIATLPAEFETLMFQIIIAALEEEGRIPVYAPWTGLGRSDEPQHPCWIYDRTPRRRLGWRAVVQRGAR